MMVLLYLHLLLRSFLFGTLHFLLLALLVLGIHGLIELYVFPQIL